MEGGKIPPSLEDKISRLEMKPEDWTALSLRISQDEYGKIARHYHDRLYSGYPKCGSLFKNCIYCTPENKCANKHEYCQFKVDLR